MSNKRVFWIIFVLFSAIVSVFLLSSCTSPNLVEITVLVLDGEGYSVDGENFRKVDKNGKISIDIQLEENYEIIYWSEGTYEDGVLTLENIKRSTTVEMQAIKVVVINYDKSQLVVDTVPKNASPYINSTLSLEINYLKENYHITSLYVNGEEIAFETQNNKYYAQVTLSEYYIDITYTEQGDLAQDFYIYNNNIYYGEAVVDTSNIRFGDIVKITADKKNNGIFNYFCINYQYYYQEEVFITVDSNSNFIIADFVSPSAVPITIDSNGGVFDDNLPITMYFESGSYKNLNWFACGLKRPGYSLVGINTEKDGTGTNHSVGALITVPSAKTTFYAQWEKHSPMDYFSYSINEDNTVTVTGLSEKAKQERIANIVVPDYIDGKAVTVIGAESFFEVDFVASVSLNSLLKRVEEKAFANSSLTTLKFYDSTDFIAGNIVDNCPNFNKITVNTNSPRVFEYVNWAYLAQKIMWYASCEKKTIVTLSGCNKVFGLDEELLLQQFEGYTLAQIGMNGAGTDMYNLYELIKPYIKKDDILLLSPEYGYSPINSSHEKAIMTNFMWEVFETNYDLLANINFTNYFSIFESYNSITELKQTAIYHNILYVSTGAYAIENHTMYGNSSYFRPNSEENYFTAESTLDYSIINEHSIRKFDEIYQGIIDSGAKAYYVFSPINENCLPEIDLTTENLEYFQNLVATSYQIPLISELKNHILPGKYFYDHNNHLTSEGANIDTATLIADLKAAMEEAVK